MKWITFVTRSTKYLNDTKDQVDSLSEEQLRETVRELVDMAESLIGQANQQRQHKVIDTNIVISRKPPARS